MVVGVSGGADSTALLRGLVLLQTELKYELVVAHLNHLLRGAASEADATWVENCCRELKVPCCVSAVDIRAMQEVGRHGIEGAARIARRRFLRQVAAEHYCNRIALAHNRNDQAETILHHILRGTGLTGLAGMRSCELDSLETMEQVSGSQATSLEDNPVLTPMYWVRPLLYLERAAIESFLQELNQDFRTDASNNEMQYTRNRIRHRLVPLLKSEFNPQIQAALCQLGSLAKEAQEAQEVLSAQNLEAALVSETPLQCRLNCEDLWLHSTAQIRGLLVLLWKRMKWPRQGMSFRHWQNLAILTQSPDGALSLPGKIDARRHRNLLVLTWQR